MFNIGPREWNIWYKEVGISIGILQTEFQCELAKTLNFLILQEMTKVSKF